MSDLTFHEAKTGRIRAALERTERLVHRPPGEEIIDTFSAVVLRSCAARYAELIEHLPRLPTSLHSQLSAMRDTMPFGADRDAVTDVLTLVKLLEDDS